jgi:outer membrane protein TolC
VVQDVRTALFNLGAARREVDLATNAVRLSTEELGQSRNRFAAGVTNNLEVVTAQNPLVQAMDVQIEALYRLQQSRADLIRAMGLVKAEYTK